MDEPVSPSNIPPPGFKSAEARKKFFIAAGLAALAVVGLQALMQFWVSSRFLPAGEMQWEVRLQNVHAESAAVWNGPSAASSGSNGDLWYVAGELHTGVEGPEEHENNRLIHVTGQRPATVFTLAPGLAWLLADGDALWIFASDGVSRYDGKTAKPVPAKPLPESASPPFLLDGRPAAVQEEAGIRRVMALENGQWVEKAQVFLGDAKDAPAASSLKVLMIGAEPYIFCPKADTLYCHKGFPGKDVRFPADWESVGPVGDLWAVAANDGRPEAFTVKTEKDRLSAETVGFAREEAGWKQDFSRVSAFPPRTLGAATDGAGGCRVVYQAVQWTVNVVQLQGDKVISARRYGDMTPADRRWVLLEILVWVGSAAMSVALAVILTRLMKAYRTESFSTPAPSTGSSGPDGGPVEWAPLTRRALALLVDAVVIFGPLVAGMIGLFWILPGIEDRPESREWSYLQALLFGGAMWAAAGFFIVCYTTGRWGRTPGKWAMGIRVLGTELAPCGFWRALLRTALLLVDGFLSFSFGPLLIACTVNRQRLGDMAARTIVVRESGHAAREL